MILSVSALIGTSAYPLCCPGFQWHRCWQKSAYCCSCFQVWDFPVNWEHTGLLFCQAKFSKLLPHRANVCWEISRLKHPLQSLVQKHPSSCWFELRTVLLCWSVSIHCRRPLYCPSLACFFHLSLLPSSKNFSLIIHAFLLFQPAKKNWRAQHEQFIAAIRYAKMATAVEAGGGSIADLPPPPKSENPDYVQCPHCSRKFNQTAAERHIPKCKDIKAKPTMLKKGNRR